MMPKIDYKNADGKSLPGVTTILSNNLAWNKGALIGWAYKRGKEGKSLRDQQALDVGTIVHQWVNSDINKLPTIPGYADELKERVESGFLAWLEWKDQVKFELVESEKSLVSEEFQYGGTIDIVALVKGIPSIIDIKTGDTYPDHKVQVRAYGTLWNENNFDRKIQSYYLLRLGKDDGGFSYHYYPSLDKEWELFKFLLQMEKYRKELS
jgi:hypothetical protein